VDEKNRTFATDTGANMIGKRDREYFVGYQQSSTVAKFHCKHLKMRGETSPKIERCIELCELCIRLCPRNGVAIDDVDMVSTKYGNNYQSSVPVPDVHESVKLMCMHGESRKWETELPKRDCWEKKNTQAMAPKPRKKE